MEYGVLTFSAYTQGDNITLNFVEVYNLRTEERSFFNGSLRNIFEGLTASGLDYIYIMNAPEFFGFIDYFATVEKLFYYDDLNDHTCTRKRITAEAWAVKDGLGAVYSRKLWLYSKKGNTRHKRLHSVSFMNFSPMVGGLDLQELVTSFSLPTLFDCAPNLRDNLLDFARCVLEFDRLYNEITGAKFLGDKFPAAWTMGGAARNYYLKLRYPSATGSRLKLYQVSHPQDVEFEYRLREDKLLMAGLLYLRKRERKFYGHIKKYDVNNLFASTERNLPDLGKFEKSNLKEYKQDKAGRYEYIFVFNRLVLKRRKDMPAVFSNPFAVYESNEETIEISQEWAVFAPFFEVLKNFYEVVSIDINEIYRAVKYNDAAIVKYVDSLNKRRATARKQNNTGLAKILKLFIVNLHGKFAQKTVTEETRFEYDIETDTIKKQETEELIDEWKQKHFDYIRGAYIYTMARVRIMQIILRFKECLPQGETLLEHIYYDDTDSVITDLDAPADMVDAYELGKLKLEEEFCNFTAIAPKTYFGRTLNGEIKLTCAGMDKDIVFKTLCREYGVKSVDELTDAQLYEIFTDCRKLYKVKILTRGKGGNVYKTVCRALTSKTSNFLL